MIYNWQHVKISRNFSAQGLTVAFTLGFEHIAGSRRAKCLAKWTGSHAFFPSEKVDIIKGTLWLKTQKISLISKTFIFFQNHLNSKISTKITFPKSQKLYFIALPLWDFLGYFCTRIKKNCLFQGTWLTLSMKQQQKKFIILLFEELWKSRYFCGRIHFSANCSPFDNFPWKLSSGFCTPTVHRKRVLI